MEELRQEVEQEREPEVEAGPSADGEAAAVAPAEQGRRSAEREERSPERDGRPPEQEARSAEQEGRSEGEGRPPEQEGRSAEQDDREAVAIGGELDELVKTARQRDEYLALAQRTQADFENYRKRVARDAAAAQERGVAKLAKELLPALDNLDRAIEAAAAEDPLLEGVRLVRKEIADALARVGVDAYAPLGEPFDPNRHEAMAQQPVQGAQAGTVAEVYQNGYRMGETVIRPARVLVAA
jgi:molecular chaperone GrpE